MRIERNGRGDSVLNPDELATKLRLSADELHRRVKAGRVTSLVEVGQGENAGLCRLTARCGGAVWRAIVGPDGSINREETGRQSETTPGVPPTEPSTELRSLETPLLSIVLFASRTIVPTTKPRALHSGLRALARKGPVRAA
jgi:hypothetical protein